MAKTYDVCETRWEKTPTGMVPRWDSTPLRNIADKLAYGMAKKLGEDPKYRGKNLVVVENGKSPIQAILNAKLKRVHAKLRQLKLPL